MAITAATADTTEAMELIAVQMLSIGFLLSVYNNYNIKLVIVFKSDTPIRADYRPCSEAVTGIPTPHRGEEATCDTADAHGETAHNSSPAGNATAKPTGRPTNASEEQRHNADTMPATGPSVPPGRAASHQDKQRTVQDAANP